MFKYVRGIGVVVDIIFKIDGKCVFVLGDIGFDFFFSF